MKNKLSLFLLRIARKICCNFSVNVIKNPEFLSKNGKSCQRNMLAAQCMLSIDKLMAEFKPKQKPKPKFKSKKISRNPKKNDKK